MLMCAFLCYVFWDTAFLKKCSCPCSSIILINGLFFSKLVGANFLRCNIFMMWIQYLALYIPSRTLKNCCSLIIKQVQECSIITLRLQYCEFCCNVHLCFLLQKCVAVSVWLQCFVIYNDLDAFCLISYPLGKCICYYPVTPRVQVLSVFAWSTPKGKVRSDMND